MYEWVYVGVVISLLTYVGAESWNIEHKIEHVPENAETIRVTGQQWFWTFEHQDGTKEIGELHVKKGVPYRFEVVSQDVNHNFNIPDFTILMDAIPGRVNTVWNTFDETGEYLIQCRDYCGLLHYDMKARLFVEEANATESAEPQGQVALAQGQAAPNGGAETANQSVSAAPPASGPTLIALAGSATQGNPDYDPDPLSVKVGESVTVQNKDTVPHTVTSGEAPGGEAGQLFDTSLIDPAGSATLDTSSLEAGEYPYHCMIHPYMKGVLTVQ
jgi:cytochrome c oxidase subunit 2